MIGFHNIPNLYHALCQLMIGFQHSGSSQVLEHVMSTYAPITKCDMCEFELGRSYLKPY